jgi:homodimeric pyruvate:ferredoxin (flavodoxin) oxidoreductase
LDGFVVSHQIEKVELVDYNILKQLVDHEAIQEHRSRALNPLHPHVRGTNQNQDVYFQNLEAANLFYDKSIPIVKEEMKKFGDATGRHYNLFDWHGPKDAKRAIIVMGSGAQTVKEAVDHLSSQGEKVGVLIPRLFRPWSAKDFLESLPPSVDRVAVLDRTKEHGSNGEPLYLDVCTSLMQAGRSIRAIGGRYGLGQKNFDPVMAIQVFNNLRDPAPKHPFTVGIEDDLTHLSLAPAEFVQTRSDVGTECLIYGFGSDGTVGANKNAVKIIGDNTDKFVQAAFQYGSSKAGGLTLSHLRLRDSPKPSYYNVTRANYLGCHNPQYVENYRLADDLALGGVFVMNSPWNTIEEMEKNFPDSLKRGLAEKNAKIFNVDAFAVAGEQGMGRLINNVMQTAFFKLSGAIEYEKAITLFKDAIKKTYGAKGDAVVQKNFNMVDATLEAITGPFEIPAHWASCPDSPLEAVNKFTAVENNTYVSEIVSQMSIMKGDDLPVSVFPVGGVMPMGTTQYEKRAFALEVPEVDMDKCTQCNYCAFSCPHAVIRPFLLSQDEADRAPLTFDYRAAKGGAEAAGLNFRIQVSAADCTGCAVCVNTCPDDALRMVETTEIEQLGHYPNWDFAMSLPDRSERFNVASVKGSQFYQPLL